MVDHDNPLLVAVADTQFDILGDGFGFLLGQGGHDSDQDLSFGIHGINIFFFKEDRDAQGLQFPDMAQAVQGIAGKAGDGLGDDHVDLSVPGLLHHLLELEPIFSGGSRDSFVGEDAG